MPSKLLLLGNLSSLEIEQIAWVFGNLPSFSSVVFPKVEEICRPVMGVVNPGDYAVNLNGGGYFQQDDKESLPPVL